MIRMDCPNLQEICRLPRLGAGGPVVYAAVEQGGGARDLLAARLLAALAEVAPEWAGAPNWGPLVLDTGPLGQPLLFLGGRPGPGVSFSEAGGLVWGALASQGRVGVDAALARDFAPPYPYARVFRPREWGWAWGHCQGRSPLAAALLWAAKEAAVKALAVGFHGLDPGNIEVENPSSQQDGLLLTVQAGGVAVTAWARALENAWLALAVA